MINQSSYSRLKTLGAVGDRYVNITTPDPLALSLEDKSIIPSRPAMDIMSLFSGESKKGDKSKIQNRLGYRSSRCIERAHRNSSKSK